MLQSIISWIIENYIEALASFVGIVSVYFAITEKPIYWILSIINAILYIFVYFDNKIYSLMVLQLMYVSMGVYGFYFWVKGGKANKNQKKVPIKNLPLKKYFVLSVIGSVIYCVIVLILKNYTDSKVPFIDALISTLAIIATILMVRKYKQHWLIWVISDVFSISLFIYKGMYAAMAMYIFMMVSSIIGFIKWSNEMKKQENFQNETINIT